MKYTKVLKALYISCALWPLVYFAAIYSFYIRASLMLGYSPRYNMPDPKTLNFDVHHDLIVYGFVFSIITFSCFLFFGFLLRKEKFLGVLFLGLVLYFVQVIHLSSDVFEWFAD